MINEELAELFERIASLLEIKGEVIYVTLAYRRAAENLRALGEDAAALHQQGRLKEIPGVGKAIAEKIHELLTTGRLHFLEELESEVPPSLLDILEIPDVGPKKVALFWKQAGILDLAGLELAAHEGRLRGLPGMGEKSEARILSGIEALRRRIPRLILSEAWGAAERWLAWLRQQPGVQRAEAAGSLRRWKTTVGDLDLVAACSSPTEVMAAFTAHPDVLHVLGQGANKSSVETKHGLKIQLWIQPLERFGSLWQYATGSKDHNVRLRERAQKLGWSLSEQSMVNEAGEERIFANEEDLYAALGLQWVPPELREDRGELALAGDHALPRLLERSDLRSDLHCHSTWSDGTASILEMARKAQANGLRCLAITDHTLLGIANGLDEQRLREQRLEIEAVRRELGDSFLLLHGAEVEIHADGTLDFDAELLGWLDLVIASLHSSLRQPRDVITARLLKAMRNPQVDIIGHPSGRLLPDRGGADLDWEQVLPAARDAGLALEINSNPHRLDLDESLTRRAVEMGIPLTLDTDAHNPQMLDQVVYGLSVARRAMLPAAAILNTWEPERLKEWLMNRGGRY